MNVHDAAYSTVHDYPGGCKSLAPRLDMSPNVLQNKVNPSQNHHKLTLDEAVRLQALTSDYRILHAMAEEFGHVCIPGGEFSGISDEALLDLFTAEFAAIGKFAGDFREAFADGEIDEDELNGLRSDAYKVKQILAEMLSRIESLSMSGGHTK